VHVNVKLKEAQSEGTHILNYDKYCRGAKDYFTLAREIITQEKAPVTVTTPDLEKKMEEFIKERLPKFNEVIFSVLAPEAKEVHVAGDFNNWQLDDNSRMIADNGIWTTKIKLTSGRYRYRFVIDGKWAEDSQNPVKEINPFGEMDSLVEIKNKEEERN
jgi:hypothetical protein